MYRYKLLILRKKWVMFPKTDSEFMYPTRVPFEESTVYSKVNIKSPDIRKYPLFKVSATI